MNDFILIKVCANRLEADIAKAYLESEGIEVIIQADDVGGMIPSLSSLHGVSLYVPKKDAEKAREILQ